MSGRGVLLALLAVTLSAAATTGAARPPAATITTVPQDAATLDRLARARANLEAIRLGHLAVGALAQQDLQDVLDLDRMLRGGTADTRTPAQQCIDDEVRRAGGRPSALAWKVIELKCK